MEEGGKASQSRPVREMLRVSLRRPYEISLVLGLHTADYNSKPEDKVFISLTILLHSTTCAYLKTKRTNLRSSGRGTIGIYTFSRWSVSQP